jgi:hypothetical protein
MTSHHNPPARTATTRRTSAQGALSARLTLAGYGFGICIAGAAITGVAGAPSPIVIFFEALALAAAADFVAVARRKRRGEPG